MYALRLGRIFVNNIYFYSSFLCLTKRVWNAQDLVGRCVIFAE